MKIKLRDLKSNPFKKEINGGKLNPGKIELLKESIKSDGFWDNVICRKKDGEFQIAYGHHRLEAAKGVLGDNYQVDIPVKDLSDEMMVRILANENSMQNEEYGIYQVDTVLMAKNWLEKLCPSDGHIGKKQAQGIGARQVSEFLGEKNWSKSKVAMLLRLNKDVDQTILEKMKNSANTNKTTGITVGHAAILSRIPDKKKQIEVSKMIEEEELNTRETDVVVKNMMGKKLVDKDKRRVDDKRIKEVMKNLDGQEMVLCSDQLRGLIEKNKITDYTEKEKALLRVCLKTLVKSITNFIGE